MLELTDKIISMSWTFHEVRTVAFYPRVFHMLSTSCSCYVIIVLKLSIEPEMTTKTDIHEKLIITMGSKLINKTMILIAIVPQATPRSCFLSCYLSLCPLSSSSFCHAFFSFLFYFFQEYYG